MVSVLSHTDGAQGFLDDPGIPDVLKVDLADIVVEHVLSPDAALRFLAAQPVDRERAEFYTLVVCHYLKHGENRENFFSNLLPFLAQGNLPREVYIEAEKCAKNLFNRFLVDLLPQ